MDFVQIAFFTRLLACIGFARLDLFGTTHESLLLSLSCLRFDDAPCSFVDVLLVDLVHNGSALVDPVGCLLRPGLSLDKGHRPVALELFVQFFLAALDERLLLVVLPKGSHPLAKGGGGRRGGEAGFGRSGRGRTLALAVLETAGTVQKRELPGIDVPAAFHERTRGGFPW